MNPPIQITVCGGGQIGHLFMAFFDKNPDIQLNILSRKAEQIKQAMPESGVCVRFPFEPDRESLCGHPNIISADPADVIPQADVIIVTVPSQVRPDLLRKIAPYINTKKVVYLGAIPGLGGFDWVAHKILKDHRNIVIWGLKDVPLACSDLVLGKEVTFLGAKTNLYLALHASHTEAQGIPIKEIVENLFAIPTHLVDDFMAITLTPGNPIMHPSLVYGQFGPYSQWDGKPLDHCPKLYGDCTELAAYFLQRCDEEVQAMRKAVEDIFGSDLYCVWPLKENINMVYGDQVKDGRTLFTTLTTNQVYSLAPLPLIKNDEGKYVLNLEHRFFTEDIPFGLELLSAIGKRLNVPTPMINEILAWAKDLIGPTPDTAANYIPDDWPSTA